MNFPDRDKVMIFPWEVPYDVCKPLMDMGFTVIENPHVDEVEHSFGLNFVALEPGEIVMPTGNPKTRELLEKAGVECIEIDVTEIIKGWGAIHCMTAFLKRETVETF
jgi:N-dimethylarginine dimethylaminohydrolase